MRDLMLDLETWGTRPGCAIRSVGAVMFDPYDEKMGYSFYRNVSLESQTPLGLRVESDTAKWWDAQDEKVVKVLHHEQESLTKVVDAFRSFFEMRGAERVWSQGANFDDPVFSAAIYAAGKRPPWKFWNSRCTRTIYAAAGLNFNREPRAGAAHNALDDAMHQVRCVQKSYRMLSLSNQKENLR